MLLCIPEVLTKEQVTHCRKVMDKADWVDGRVTAGAAVGLGQEQPAAARRLARRKGARRDRARGPIAQPAVHLRALPHRIFPPLFNRYGSGHHFGTHVDGAIRAIPGTPIRIRTDLSITLFLAEPDEYDGGELTVEDKYGTHEVKLPAGDLVLYPSTSLHHVKPVTRGTRMASFFWLQSMVREDSQRALLFDLDQTIQELSAERGIEDAACVRLTGIYHNLIRQWAEV